MLIVTYHTCPVCGYDQLEAPAKNNEICPSCGTEFGYEDVNTSHAELRRRWLAKGAPWFDDYTTQPPHWNPIEQIIAAGYDVPAEALMPVTIGMTLLYHVNRLAHYAHYRNAFTVESMRSLHYQSGVGNPFILGTYSFRGHQKKSKRFAYANQ